MPVTIKATKGLDQLPMNVASMVLHRHGDGAYAYYCPQCWLGDSNTTISSLARLFHQLEGPSIWEFGALFEYLLQNSLFEVLLRRKFRCIDILQRIEGMDFQRPKALPRK